MPVDPLAPTGPLSGARRARSESVSSWDVMGRQVREDAPEWRYPRSIETAEQMLNRAQVWSLFSATVLPIEGYEFWLDPNGNDEARTGLLAEDLGLPVGEPEDDGLERTSQPGEFDFHDLLHEALMALAYGHYMFEWTGEIRDGIWRIDGIAPLHPATVTTIKTDRQGRLEWVSQGAGASFNTMGGQLMAGMAPRIPESALIPFVYWPDARRRWTGRSMFRAIYQDYVANDILARTDVANHEKAGGIPFMMTDERYAGTSLDDLARLAQETRLTEDGGAAVPPGVTPVLLRGGGTDIVGSMKYHDEMMARAWHSMVRQLGSTETGSRALGSTFNDLEALARRSIANWVCRVVNQYVCARYFLWNFGEPGPDGLRLTQPPPVVRFSTGELEASSAPEDPGGGMVPPSVAAASRNRPSRHAAQAAPADVASGPAGDPSRRSTQRGRTGALVAGAQPDFVPRSLRSMLPERELRRGLSDVEVAAAVDFAAIDAAYMDAADRLERAFLTDWLPEQLDAIEDAIAYTRTGTVRQRLTALDMARIDVPTAGVTELEDELLAVARESAAEAALEMGAQGLPMDAVEDAAFRARVVDHARAVAQLMSEGIQVAASRRAVQLVGSGMTPSEVAAEVRAYVEGLTHTWERDQLAGAVQQAQNAGRLEVFELVSGPITAYASEILDASTCDACRLIDGTVFVDMQAARRAYPSGGYRDCAGGPRCRGTVIAVLGDEAPIR